MRQGCIRSALLPVINWINSHGNPQLGVHGVRVELGWFQATASGYYQLGALVAVDDVVVYDMRQLDKSSNDHLRYPQKIEHRLLFANQLNIPMYHIFYHLAD